MYTLQQAAAHLGISESTMRRIIRRGEIAAIRVGLRKLVIEEEEIQRYLERQKEQSGKVEAVACA